MKFFLTIFCLFSLTIINASAQQVDDFPNSNNEAWQSQLQTAIRIHINRLLGSSVRRNNHEEVRELLVAGADPNTQAYNRGLAVPVLQLAVAKGSSLIAATLLEAGANPSPHLFGKAIESKDSLMIQAFLAAGVDLQANFDFRITWEHHDYYVDSVLLAAVMIGNVQLVNALMARGVYPESILINYIIPQVEYFRLSQHQLFPSRRPNISSLLSVAAIGRDTPMMEALLDAGMDPDSKDLSMGGLSPLHIAAFRSDLEMLRLLIEKGADPNLRDSRGRGRTPIQLASGPDAINFLAPLIEVDLTIREYLGDI